jgi:hypothetical protein
MQPEMLNPGWNELQFVSWREFKQMAPPILRLEVGRLGRAIEAVPAGSAFHDSLVRARFALQQFIAGLERAGREDLEESVAHLRAAIMNVASQPAGLDDSVLASCRYTLDRLNYVYRRISLIY